MSEREIVSWLLIPLALVDLAVTVVLVRAARRSREPALQERATISVILTVGAIAAASLGTAYLVGFSMQSSLSFALLAAVLIIVSAPQLVWYALYRMGRFE